ncbi:hypothetical protein GOB94_12035 [Granulicella sp. 5B5]|uniref:hypothetical protein n=1 Tax=Granulicella sp. 5B5 TaxID=1617967 RepID=UPI0015F49A9E|nr:hypothetical protein [Granulicella sp. 5B5]QMV19330.1 hypothetical protein GOB94_12035 [Granulicella sp. 5B5]
MAEELVIEKYVIRLLVRGVMYLVLLVIAAYPVDWVVWRARVAAGDGMGQVQVSEMTAAEMKGGKETYYFNGTSMVDCSESLYPQAGAGACWWVKRHPIVTTKY